MIDDYPPLHGTNPKTMYARVVPRESDGENFGSRGFDGVTEHVVHQMRAVYQFDLVTIGIYPEFTEESDTWTPEWYVDVTDDTGGDTFGPFKTPGSAVQHAENSLAKLGV